MQVAIRKSMVAGVITAAIGLAILVNSLVSYRVGTLVRVDSGMFPAILGGILALTGVIIVVTERDDAVLTISVEPMLIFARIIGAVLAFAWAAPSVGLLPAIAIMSVLAMAGHPDLRWTEIVLTAVALCVLAVAVFHYALSVPFILFRWPI